MKVDLIDHMGSDLSVVNAARVSFDKESWWENEEAWLEFDEPLKLSERDSRLIGFLAKHNHWSPFAHTSIQFRIKAPIFVARQLGKHQVGLVWNEVSRRYVDAAPEFYEPETWRMKAENKKQGSSDEAVTDPWLGLNYMVVLDQVRMAYEYMLRAGVCPEQARMVLPQSMMTEWIWTGSLHAFARVVSLRDKPDAQKETQQIAQMIADHCANLFPVSWAALTNKG